MGIIPNLQMGTYTPNSHVFPNGNKSIGHLIFTKLNLHGTMYFKKVLQLLRTWLGTTPL